MTLPALEEIERTLMQLKGVEAARVCAEGDHITEVHVVATEGSRPKNIARDVRSYMVAALGIDVPHQKISVAVPGRESGAPVAEDGPLTAGLRGGPGAAAAQPDLGDEPVIEEEPLSGGRIRFRSVNLLVEGVRSEVQVVLEVSGRTLHGTAEGAPASLGTERLIAAATLQAVERLVRDDVRLLPGDLTFTRCGHGEAVVVEIVVVHPRSEQRLVGACRVQQDRHRCVVFAVLDGLNRMLETLVPQEWVEFDVHG